MDIAEQNKEPKNEKEKKFKSSARYLYVYRLFYFFVSIQLSQSEKINVEDFHWAWFYGRDMLGICICLEDWNETEETMDADERKMLDGSAFCMRCESKKEQT